MSTRSLGSGALLALLVGGACTKEAPPAPPPGQWGSAAPAAPAPAAMTTPAQTAPAMTAPAPTAPPAGGALSPDDLSGSVVETMSSGGYTYAKVIRGNQTAWLAGPETPLAVGATLGKTTGSLMTNFHSDTLNRTFDQIYFVDHLAIAGAAPTNPHGAAAAPVAVDKVEPVAGGKTVAQVYADKATLAGKPVALRGKVVKVNNGILGKNWLHVQDGTGAAGTNDLIVTTAATVAKDDVVVIRGTVALDKDLGAGYRYAVLIEDATVAAK